jgi:4-hydroxy-tetrahydrodipicolinate synthase
MRDDQSVDEQDLESYLGWLLSKPGFSGMVINVFAGEGVALGQQDRLLVARTARRVIPASMKLIAGACGNSTVEMIEQVKAYEDAGADAAIIVAMREWEGSRAPGHAERMFEAIGRATKLPLVVFQSPAGVYDTPTLVNILQVPTVVAVKQAIFDIAVYQAQLRAIRRTRPDVAVLSAYDAALFPTLAIGADGVLLGIAGLLPTLIIDIYNAMKRGDYEAGRRLCDELDPMSHHLYAVAPRALRHVRSKAALKELGLIKTEMVREPQLPLDEKERAMLMQVMQRAGLIAPPKVKIQAVS